MKPTSKHLEPTPVIESDHDSVRAFARRHAGRSEEPIDRAVNLYYAVRDRIRYNPYTFALSVESLKASVTLAAREAWCVPKAALLAACLRVMGIPARVGYADVRNHLSTRRLREMMKTDVFHWHGYTVMYLDGKWVKSTPAFNIELCEKFRLKPLEFDGRKDSLYHPFDLDGKRHMQYVRFRGEYDDVPVDMMRATFTKVFGGAAVEVHGADFEADCENETP